MIAVLLLSLLAADDGAYDALVARAIAESRAGRTDAAGQTLGSAIALDPRRPEALVERGGLRFLEKRYDDAIDDLDAALRIREDAYARDLLASTLLLTGRHERAIAEWNRLGKPALGTVKLLGLRHAEEPAVRRELTLDEGGRLDVRDFRGTRLRLEETGFFQTIDMRPVVAGPGTVDLEIAVLERHGFGSVLQVAPRFAGDLLRQKVRFTYANLPGRITLGGEYRWEATQPLLGFRMDAFRPLGFPGMLTIDGLGSRPTYDFEDGRGPFRLRTRGGGVRGRVVVASRTVAEAGLRVRDRTWAPTPADAQDGTVVGLQLGLDRTFWSGRRHDLGGSVRVLTAPSMLGGDIHFTRTTARLVHHLHVQRPDAFALEHGSIAVQALLGYAGAATPIDEMYAPGAASEMDLPLRAHRLKNDGVLGGVPIARSIALLNVEWRQRYWKGRLAQAGGVFFYDGGRMGRTVQGGSETLHDVGVGARIGLRGTIILRADFAWSLTDGKTALTAGMGQVF